jgi:hypothetical protein
LAASKVPQALVPAVGVWSFLDHEFDLAVCRLSRSVIRLAREAALKKPPIAISPWCACAWR